MLRVDYVGSVIFVASNTSFLVPLTWGGVSYPWDSWHTLVPLLVGVAGIGLFIVWEERFAKEPLIPLRITKNRSAAVNYLGAFLQGLILVCALYYLPLYYEVVLGYDAIVAGVALFPQTFTVAPAAVFVGILVTKTGRYRWAIWGGWFLSTLGMGLIILLGVHTSIPAWIFITIVGGFGLGMLFPSMMFAVQAAVPEADVGAAVSFFTFIRTFGQAVGIGIGGVVFQNQIKKEIMKYPLIAPHAEEYSQDASALVGFIKSLPAGQEKYDLQESYASALRIVWAVLTGLAFVGLIASLATKGYSMDRKHDVEQKFDPNARKNQEKSQEEGQEN